MAIEIGNILFFPKAFNNNLDHFSAINLCRVLLLIFPTIDSDEVIFLELIIICRILSCNEHKKYYKFSDFSDLC